MTDLTRAPIFSPFAALRPTAAQAAAVAAPPYDVLSTDEARALAEGRPRSFLHVSRPEIDLPAATDPHAPEVYAKGAENLRRLVTDGVLTAEAAPAYYVYRMTSGERRQTGIAAAASVADYRTNRVRRHELTRPDKEDDRVHHMVALNAQTGPVFVVHRANPGIAAVIGRAVSSPPLLSAEVAKTRHEVWAVMQAAEIKAVTDAFEAMEAVYIADGHHRSAAAERVAGQRSDAGPHQRFLVVSFPDDEVRILDYNRVVRDLGGRSAEAFLADVGERFEIMPATEAVRPASRGSFGLYLAGKWYRLDLRGGVAADAAPLDRLDVGLLARHLLQPVLGIADPRTDPRIDFVGGARGLDGLAARVDSGEMAAAFALWPTQLADLMAVADAGQIMPPKSTWFEPKLADGLLIHPLGPVGG